MWGPFQQGNHGHISISMNIKIYKTLVTMEWTNPPDTGVYPTIPTNATTALQDQLQLQHDKGQIIYKNTGTMDEALKNQVIDTVKDTYLNGLNNKYTGLLRVTCCDLLQNLIDRYGKIMTTDLEYNNQQMNNPVHFSFPIDNNLSKSMTA